jgi:hypothetical protein
MATELLLMLHRLAPLDEEGLIEALKGYIPRYSETGDNCCDVPYKDMETGKFMLGKFLWLAQQWVFIEYREC